MPLNTRRANWMVAGDEEIIILNRISQFHWDGNQFKIFSYRFVLAQNNSGSFVVFLPYTFVQKMWEHSSPSWYKSVPLAALSCIRPCHGSVSCSGHPEKHLTSRVSRGRCWIIRQPARLISLSRCISFFSLLVHQSSSKNDWRASEIWTVWTSLHFASDVNEMRTLGRGKEMGNGIDSPSALGRHFRSRSFYTEWWQNHNINMFNIDAQNFITIRFIRVKYQ